MERESDGKDYDCDGSYPGEALKDNEEEREKPKSYAELPSRP